MASLPVPEAIASAHRRAWDRLAAPGDWWTGAERVAIAAAVRAPRDCELCRARRVALSPSAVVGEHTDGGMLPVAAVEAAHRIASDPGRLTRAWYDGTIAPHLSDGAYVELVGVVTTVVDVDAFRRALGLPLEPLPAPRSGEPARPARVRDDIGAWVPVLAPSTPEARELFQGRSRAPNVARAMSLVPDAVVQLKELSDAHYLPMDDVIDPRKRGRLLTRPQMELIAGRVSALNQCFY
jgi:hypothetical protein